MAQLLQKLRIDRRAQARGQGPSYLRMPGWLLVVTVLAVLAVIVTEFAVDLADYPALRDIVVIVDLGLVLGFLGWHAVHLLRNRHRLFQFLFEERLDLLVVVLAAIVAAVVPRAGAAIVIARLVLTGAGKVLGSAFATRIARFANLKPSQTLALSFLALLAAGTALLMLPASTVDGEGARFIDALFTATSATCVTGLVVQDTGTHFTPFGQVVILLLIQAGAIGMLVLGAAFVVLVGGRLPGRQQVGLGSLLEVQTPEGIKRLVTAVTAATFGTELIGAAALYVLWGVGVMDLPARYDDAAGALWWSLFHSISAFCNAGFALAEDSLSMWVGNPMVSAVFVGLITAGGLGFVVVLDLTNRQNWGVLRPGAIWSRLQVQTRVVLVATLVLDLVGALAFLFFEYDGALAGLSIPTKLNAALFQGVTLRTAGFNTVPLGALAAPTVIVCVVWMFIGAGPGSTGGGVKTTTAATVIMAVRAMLRGREEVELFGRAIPQVVVYRSISIVFIAGAIIASFLVLLTATQGGNFERLAFETVSAFGTVGLSMGATSELDTVGKALVTMLMYTGRVGPLTLALAIGERTVPKGYKYPQGRMAVG